MTNDDSSPRVPRWRALPDDLSARQMKLRRLADAGRDVIERIAGNEVSDAMIDEAADLLEAAAKVLKDPGTHRRYFGFAESANAGHVDAPFDHSPLMGIANAVAPPARIDSSTDNSIVMSVRFGSAYEGPPGCVHGGFVAAMFDELLGLAQSLGGRPGMTGTLKVRYRRPTPLHRDLRFEGTLDRSEGRKIFTSARCYDGDTLTAQAEALFVTVDFAKLTDMVAQRDVATDAGSDPGDSAEPQG